MSHILVPEIKAPVITPETGVFWSAANREKLLFGQCQGCDIPHFYPRRLCPHCFSDDVIWPQSAGLARIYAFSIARKAQPIHVAAWVTLDEGVTLMTKIIDCETDRLHIGQALRVVFPRAANGQAVPMFAPVAAFG